MRISGITYAHRKTRKVRYGFIVTAGVILLALLTVMLVSVYAGWSLIHPARISIPVFSANIAPEYKDVSFKDTKGKITLKGWYFESRGSDKTIILAHGYKENRLQFKEKTLDLVKSFLDKGYNFLLFDFRNSGLSGGNFTSVGLYEKDDLLGAIKYVKSQGAKHTILLGYSMGAAAGILAAADSKDVDAVIADSSFSNLKEYLSKELPVWSKLPPIPFNATILFSLQAMTGIDPGRVNPKQAMAAIAPRPVFLIHSKDDKNIPASNSRELYGAYVKAGGSKIEFWQPEGTNHAKSYEKIPEEYIRRVFDFLDNKVYPKSK